MNMNENNIDIQYNNDYYEKVIDIQNEDEENIFCVYKEIAKENEAMNEIWNQTKNLEKALRMYNNTGEKNEQNQ